MFRKKIFSFPERWMLNALRQSFEYFFLSVLWSTKAQKKLFKDVFINNFAWLGESFKSRLGEFLYDRWPFCVVSRRNVFRLWIINWRLAQPHETISQPKTEKNLQSGSLLNQKQQNDSIEIVN